MNSFWQTLRIENDWAGYLNAEFEKAYMDQLGNFLSKEEKAGKIIYPQKNNFFRALRVTGFNQVKAVILGQDPYHGPGEAEGLSFSVPEGTKLPPSLKNIFTELSSDLQIPASNSGSLISWAQQGVLLLNSVLSVEENKPGSHRKKGWETFTDRIISVLNEKKENMVFILWGAYAISKGKIIDRHKHLVLESVHPSPLSSYRGFFGSRPFSKCNEYLMANRLEPVDWKL